MNFHYDCSTKEGFFGEGNEINDWIIKSIHEVDELKEKIL